jgi:hypothetical protein
MQRYDLVGEYESHIIPLEYGDYVLHSEAVANEAAA